MAWHAACQRQTGRSTSAVVIAVPAGEFLGAGRHSMASVRVALSRRSAGGRDPVVRVPVPAVFEGVGRQVDGVGRLPQRGGEVGQMAGDVGAGQRFGDLALVGDVAPQRRYGPGSGRRVGPGPQGGGGEYRLRAHLEQQCAAQLGQGGDTLGEFDRLAGMSAPVRAVEPGVPPEDRPGPVAHQNPLRRAEFDTVRNGFEVVESRIQQGGVERVAGVQAVTADPSAVNRSSAPPGPPRARKGRCSRRCRRPPKGSGTHR